MDSLGRFVTSPSAFTLRNLLAPPLHASADDAPAANRSRPVRVASVGADAKLRQAITCELAGDSRIWLVACARSLADSTRIPEFDKVDVLLVGPNLGNGRGLDLIASLKQSNPHARAIVISDEEGDEGALRAIESGAAGWLALDSWRGGFMLAVLTVAQGGCALSLTTARRLVHRAGCQSHSRAPAKITSVSLTEREREVLEHVAAGLATKEIARRMDICSDTVNFHVKSIYRKLQAHTRTHLVRLATDAGILPH